MQPRKGQLWSEKSKRERARYMQQVKNLYGPSEEAAKDFSENDIMAEKRNWESTV